MVKHGHLTHQDRTSEKAGSGPDSVDSITGFSVIPTRGWVDGIDDEEDGEDEEDEAREILVFCG